jgi:hypothetical protein
MRLRSNHLCPRAQCLATTADELRVALTSTAQLLHTRVNCLVLDNHGESHKHSEAGSDHGVKAIHQLLVMNQYDTCKHFKVPNTRYALTNTAP